MATVPSAADALRRREAPPASLRFTRRDVRLISEAARWAALAYVPAALLTLLGFLGILRRRFGRALGTFSLRLGLASIATWLALHFGLQLALREAELRQIQVSLPFGAHLLLLAGAAGVMAGLGALIRPDLGRPPLRPPARLRLLAQLPTASHASAPRTAARPPASSQVSDRPATRRLTNIAPPALAQLRISPSTAAP